VHLASEHPAAVATLESQELIAARNDDVRPRAAVDTGRVRSVVRQLENSTASRANDPGLRRALEFPRARLELRMLLHVVERELSRELKRLFDLALVVRQEPLVPATHPLN